MHNLEILRDSSSLQQLELKLKETKTQPQEVDKFVDKLKKDLDERRNKFEELKEFIT